MEIRLIIKYHIWLSLLGIKHIAGSQIIYTTKSLLHINTTIMYQLCYIFQLEYNIIYRSISMQTPTHDYAITCNYMFNLIILEWRLQPDYMCL